MLAGRFCHLCCFLCARSLCWSQLSDSCGFIFIIQTLEQYRVFLLSVNRRENGKVFNDELLFTIKHPPITILTATEPVWGETLGDALMSYCPAVCQLCYHRPACLDVSSLLFAPAFVIAKYARGRKITAPPRKTADLSFAMIIRWLTPCLTVVW